MQYDYILDKFEFQLYKVSVKVTVAFFQIFFYFITLATTFMDLLSFKFTFMLSRSKITNLMLNNTNLLDTEASFLDLQLSISDVFVQTKIYNNEIILIMIL